MVTTERQAGRRSHRILLVITDLANGGAQTMNFRLAKALRARGHEVDVAVIFDRAQSSEFELRYPSVKIVRLGADKPLQRLMLPIRLARIARNYEMVISGMDFAATNHGFIAAAIARKPFASWMHIAFRERASSASWISRLLSHLVYRLTRHIVFPSSGAMESLLSSMGKMPKNASWRVIENFDSPEAWEYGETPASLRHAFAKPVVLSVGRLATQKAYHRLLRAHANLVGRGIDHNVVILGDGDQRASLQAEAESQQLASSFLMPGHLLNVRSLIRQSTLFALCSEYEGLPLVLLEALHEGAAIVAMDCPSGPLEILDGGSAGKLTPSGDQAAFEAGLAELLQSPALRSKYAASAKTRSRHFSLDRILPLWEEFLDDLSPLQPAPPVTRQ